MLIFITNIGAAKDNAAVVILRSDTIRRTKRLLCRRIQTARYNIHTRRIRHSVNRTNPILYHENQIIRRE